MQNLSSHRLPLAAACLLLFAASADVAYAALPVTNCNDAGAGSLRASIASAATGDDITIPSNLGCSKITLRTGALAVTQNDLTISGPGADQFTITGKYVSPGGTSTTEHYRIFTHTGSGELDIDDVTLSKGYLQTSGGAAAKGGCVYSAGKLSMSRSSVFFCTAKSGAGYSAGGALFTRKGLYLNHSTVSYNLADAATGNSSGGGIAAEYEMNVKYSTISHNTAGNTTTKKGDFGGFLSVDNGDPNPDGLRNIIGYSTISDNYASRSIGGGGIVGNVTSIIDSVTVANNSTAGNVGGLYLAGYGVGVSNSTIAFNSGAGNGAQATGVQFVGVGAGSQATLYSTIVSNNYLTGGAGPDVSATAVTIGGSKNLVYDPAAPLPADTIVNKCPLLDSLGDNGGERLSIKLLGHSLAIDRGNNPLNLQHDGRGIGFARASGPPAGAVVVDIGAYEVNRTDEIFDNTFDAHCSGVLARADP
jgi:hypothetical protein